jgi:hypothetical protein
MRKKFTILAVMTAVVVILSAGIVAFVRARNTSAVSSCINNLRHLDAAKQQWAVDNSKSTNDLPTWEVISSYLRHGVPICPQGGKYTLEGINNAPRCSLGGPSHTLP